MIRTGGSNALSTTLVLIITVICSTQGQRITTIQLDGVQYFVSRMNPYAPELNYFLSYQYCRSLGLQLVSFETREKADSITQYLVNAGYSKFDFWTSGNQLGTDMKLWMSTGLPFNATFNYMRKTANDVVTSEQLVSDVPSGSTSPQRTARESGNNGSGDGCVALKGPTFAWDTDDCMTVKDFICEQTRCYYYNYGSIPVSSAQGKPHFTTTLRPSTTTTTRGSQPSVNLGISDFINKVYTKVSYGASTTSKLHPSKDMDKNEEVVTNGPYDSDNISVNAELHDDPAVIADHALDEDYVSTTMEPEGAISFSNS